MSNSIIDTRKRVAPPVSGRVGYAVAVAAVAVATLVRSALDPVFGDNYPFLTFFLAFSKDLEGGLSLFRLPLSRLRPPSRPIGR